MSEYKTFGEMTKEERSELVEAALAGLRVDVENLAGEWAVHSMTPGVVAFYSEGKYRIAPTKPSIDWSHVHPDYKWLAVDKEGFAGAYKDEPRFSEKNQCWFSELHDGRTVNHFSSFKPGTCKPEDSLVMRPEGV